MNSVQSSLKSHHLWVTLYCTSEKCIILLKFHPKTLELGALDIGKLRLSLE